MPASDDPPLPFLRPTAERPLAGQTVLVVDDSRFASEAIRMLALRSGARIRRADSLRTAARHLATYRPSVVIVDLGLPDGEGTSLIADLAATGGSVVIAMSGDDTVAERALAAGADAFFAKPVSDLAAFQTRILRHLPEDARPKRLMTAIGTTLAPDPAALQDDLAQAAAALDAPGAEGRAAYLAQFLSTLGQSARDGAIEAAGSTLADASARGQPRQGLQAARGLIASRLVKRAV